MWMTESEIAKEYREAKNKKHQISILADQNVCSHKQIREILIKMGEIESKEPEKKVRTVAPLESTKKEIKVEAPTSVKKMALERLEELEKEIIVFEQRRKILESEYMEIAEWLKNN